MDISLTPLAQNIYNYLPTDGSGVSGGKVKEHLAEGNTKPSPDEFKKAKQELKEAGLVELGRGRGGTLKRRTDVEAPAPIEKKSKEELLEIAREEKTRKNRAQKAIDDQREFISQDVARKLEVHPEQVRAFPELPDMTTAIVEVWDGWINDRGWGGDDDPQIKDLDKGRNAKSYRWHEELI
jgi:DNA-binding transcriptional regulator YhcF (GntR family)